MLQNLTQYQVEKMIQMQHEAMNKKMRTGMYIKEITSQNTTLKRQAGQFQRLLRKWFKKRRLDTSSK